MTLASLCGCEGVIINRCAEAMKFNYSAVDIEADGEVEIVPDFVQGTIAVAQANGLDHPMFFMTICFAAVMDGSVYGDQCSPISDTTVLSSVASGCDHIEHVRTQLPYALLVGFVGLGVGTIPGGDVGNVCKGNAPPPPSVSTIAGLYTAGAMKKGRLLGLEVNYRY